VGRAVQVKFTAEKVGEVNLASYNAAAEARESTTLDEYVSLSPDTAAAVPTSTEFPAPTQRPSSLGLSMLGRTAAVPNTVVGTVGVDPREQATTIDADEAGKGNERADADDINLALTRNTSLADDAVLPPPPPMPPAHRWVRTASTMRVNRTNSSSQRGMNASTSCASTNGNLARSIRDIIRQRSREERASDVRARVSKRKNGEGCDDGEKRISTAAAAALPNARALASQTDGGGDSTPGAEALPCTILGFSGRTASGPVSMTPQVLVVNGQIVINEKSLTVNAAVERATALSDFTRVEENGTRLNSATYASYTKAEKWTSEDTEFFFQALQQFGTDFSLIQRLFPGRSRRQIKKKYLVEDKINPGRIEAAIKNLNPNTTLYQNLIDVLQTPVHVGTSEDGMARAVLDRDVGDNINCRNNSLAYFG